jgi:methionyl-tRNA formyltransferase
MRLAFAGTPDFAAEALRALVLTQPDRPAGRGLKLHASAVKALAVDLGIAVIQPRSLRLDGKFEADAQAAQAALQAAGVEAMVVAAYGLILPSWVLELPGRGCLNIHASLLPRWRGAAPIHRAIEAGDTHTGITIMQMDAGLDTGDMLLDGGLPILPDDTTGALHDRLARLGGQLITQALASPQLPHGATYAHKIAKSEAPINWTDAATVIERRLRAFDPFPGATFVCAGKTLKLWRARVVPCKPGGAPGEVLTADADNLTVACGDGCLTLIELQVPGGKRAGTAQVVQSQNLTVGARLD